MDTDYHDSEGMTALLRQAFPEATIETWHTGGGCMNPTIVLGAKEYIMFSVNWGPGEGSFGRYAVRPDSDGEPEYADEEQWSSSDPPMAPVDIADLVRDRWAAWTS